MSMASTAISRNANRFRFIISRHHLCSQSSTSNSLNQWRSPTTTTTSTTPPSFNLFRRVSDFDALHHHPRQSPLSVIALSRGVPSLEMNYRYMCTSTATVPPENSASKTSEQGGKSGESDQSGDAGKSVRGGPVSWLSFILLIVTGAGLVFYYDQQKKRHIEGIHNSSNAVKTGPSVGQAAIGGPFSLVNHEGKRVTEKDFLGKWTVMYFGFTHCPDICPDELQKLASAVDKIKEKARIEVVPVFISVDPERDTVEQVREYVTEFHPNLIGLTGSKDEIRKVAQAYRVYYMKAVDPDSEADDYLVDHSIIMYLMSPGMDFVKYFGKNYDVDELTEGIVKEIKQYKK